VGAGELDLREPDDARLLGEALAAVDLSHEVDREGS
jgi:hypothetical protein